MTRGTNKLECLFEVNILCLFGIDAGLLAQQRVVELTVMDDLHWRDLYAKTPEISPSLLALATLGGATQIGLFLFLVASPKVAKAGAVS